jgi:ATP-dependent RNA helicase RhlE
MTMSSRSSLPALCLVVGLWWCMATGSTAFSTSSFLTAPRDAKVGRSFNNFHLQLAEEDSQEYQAGDQQEYDDEEEEEEGGTFFDLGLKAQVLAAVQSQSEWDRPTPVQRLAIPKLLQLGSNNYGNKEQQKRVDAVWCEAPTGSGKTAAYSLPLLQNLVEQQNTKTRTNKVVGRVASLILCPTRELAVQIGSVVQNLASNISTKNGRQPTVMTIYGGIPIQPQISALADAARLGETVDILVATPGRLVDVLTYYNQRQGESSAKDAAMERRLLNALDNQGSSDASLSLEDLNELKLGSIDSADGRSSLVNLLEGLEYLILDEADRLLGRAFESELNSVLDLLPPRIPTWMFSATFPKSIEPRLDQVLTRTGASSPIRIECASSDRLTTEDVSSSLQRKLERTATTSAASKIQQVGPASTIQLRAIRLRKNDRTQALRQLLEEHPEWDRVLVFVGTRYSTEHVTRKLRRANIKTSELHGKLDQDARMRRLEDLKKGKIRVLLTTDVSSRGIDIEGLPVVVNYDLPRSTSDFVHRVGRTGRAGKQGTAITFVTGATESQMELIEQRHLAEPIEREVLPGFDPNEEKWEIEAEASRISVPGAVHSEKGLAHDRMFGGIKGYRKNKKDKLREAAAREAAKQQP